MQSSIPKITRLQLPDEMTFRFACGSRAVILSRPYSFVWDSHEYIVPAGFKSDLASVPRIFWRILPPFGSYSTAAVIHDWLCVTKAVSRREADEAFREAMIMTGVPLITRSIMYWAVRSYAVMRGLKLFEL